ncbi:MAG: hypothetical protein U1E60_21895 [Reyranellaceae bacterium]
MFEGLQAFQTAIRWIWRQIESFPVPIEEIMDVHTFAGADFAVGTDTARRRMRRPGARALKFRDF